MEALAVLVDVPMGKCCFDLSGRVPTIKIVTLAMQFLNEIEQLTKLFCVDKFLDFCQ